MAILLALPCLGVGKTLRLMTFNIYHCGKGMDRVARCIESASPDFACLNEVDRGVKRSGGIDQTAELARRTGMHGTFAKALNLGGGAYGVAILSKEEPVSVDRVPLPGREKRVLLICEFRNCVVATAHLDLHTQNQLKSIGVIRSSLGRYSKPVFFGGDWNATPESATIREIEKSMKILSPVEGVKTFIGGSQKDKPEYVIDYIAAGREYADRLEVVRAYVGDDKTASDHVPVVVELRRRR